MRKVQCEDWWEGAKGINADKKVQRVRRLVQMMEKYEGCEWCKGYEP